MQNIIISWGQGSPVGGSHFLPWPFSPGIEDHVTQMSAHNTSLAIETGRWSWFHSYNWLHYGAEAKKKKKPGIFWPALPWRSRENLRKPQKSPNLVAHLSYLIQYGIEWQKLKTFPIVSNIGWVNSTFCLWVNKWGLSVKWWITDHVKALLKSALYSNDH